MRKRRKQRRQQYFPGLEATPLERHNANRKHFRELMHRRGMLEAKVAKLSVDIWKQGMLLKEEALALPATGLDDLQGAQRNEAVSAAAARMDNLEALGITGRELEAGDLDDNQEEEEVTEETLGDA